MQLRGSVSSLISSTSPCSSNWEVYRGYLDLLVRYVERISERLTLWVPISLSESHSACLVAIMVQWHLWLSRNKIFFDGFLEPPSTTILKITSSLRDLSSSTPFKRGPRMQRVPVWQSND
ncbi:hypothetical protein ACH5RR_025980 [Cinchona calisaya]|uniref:Maturase K n=1 Tax=Cinchona calisaya TaxID=153742 RepID=A0ABD2Z2C5_9GENT